MVHSLRFGLGVGLCGLLLFGYAVRLTNLNSGASSVPVEVELASLEQAGKPPDLHLKIGEHIRLYGGMIYEYDAGSAPAKPNASTRINYCYYPIVSTTHSEAESEGDEAGGKASELDRVTVLVKTHEFPTVGEVDRLPRWQKSRGVTGLVVNGSIKLVGPERSLLRRAFPKIDLDRVILLEVGRHPASLAMLALVWGLSLVLLGTAACLIPWTSGRRRQGRATLESSPAASEPITPTDPDHPAAIWFARKAREAKLDEEEEMLHL